MAALSLGLAALLPKWAFAKKYGVALSKVPALKKVGGAVTIRLADTDLLLIRISKEEVRGFNAVCTHQSCPVAFKQNEIVCDCHHSHFDLTGKVKHGPATKSLKTIPVALDGERIIVGDL